MALFRISLASGSVVSAIANAFSQTGPGELDIAADGFLISTLGAGDGALLAGGSWTVKANGNVYGGNTGLNFTAFAGAVDTVTVGAAASVFGTSFAIHSANKLILSNSGRLATGAGGSAVFTDSADDKVTNAGTISGALNLGAGKNVVTNSGTLTGNVFTSGGDDTLTNSGTLSGFVLLGNGTNTITNSGTLSGQIIFGTGADTVKNTGKINATIVSVAGDATGDTINNGGTITGDIKLLAGSDIVTNSGKINGNVDFGDGTDRLVNSGVIDTGGVSVRFGTGHATVTNSGTMTGLFTDFSDTSGDTVTNRGKIGLLTLSAGADTLVNSGHITSTVVLFGGDDKFTDFETTAGGVVSGTVTGTIDMGAGADTFTGGASAERVNNDAGADLIVLGGGNDTYLIFPGVAGDGNDTVKGGAGIDLFDASAATSSIFVNLDTVAHNHIGSSVTAFSAVAATTAFGINVSGDANPDDGLLGDTVTSFENVTGGTGDDSIWGSSGGNLLLGSDGNDRIAGLGGNDTIQGGNGGDVLIGDDFAAVLLNTVGTGNDLIDGGAGSDFITGGGGKDTLTGGADGDFFAYYQKSDSGATSATRDIITDFTSASDFIFLNPMDANDNLSGNQNFTLTSNSGYGAFTGVAGQLRFLGTAAGTVILADTNGDKTADFSILVAGAALLTNSDVIL